MKCPDRPWPAPERPWTMFQQWCDLLFAHWPLPADELRPLIPRSVELDTFDGQAWIGIVPFHMRGIRHRFLPPLPGLSAFAELNVRTYVTLDNKPGVYFFSLDATNPLAVAGARMWYHLPYFKADIRCEVSDDRILYSSRRSHFGSASAEFIGNYRATAPVSFAAKGSLEHWLTERYCLYAVDRNNNLYRGEVDHMHWPLQSAEAEIERNTLTSPLGVQLPDTKPLFHFSKRLDVRLWPLERVATAI